MRRKLYSKDDQHIIYRRKMLCFRRTEYGKQIRKSYENHRIYEKRSNIQKLEPSDDGIAHCITTVLKDSMYVGKVSKVEEKNLNDYLYTDDSGEQYGIFKLSPRECLRLMNVRDTDIDKMQEVNSNTQCYKQSGNSIVVSVLVGIFSQLGIKGVKRWNDMTNDERYEIIRPGG